MPKQTDLSEHTFLNPGYRASWDDPERGIETRAMDLAATAHGLTMTALLAFENDTSGIPMKDRGIAQTLETVGAILGDLTDEADMLCRKVKA